MSAWVETIRSPRTYRLSAERDTPLSWETSLKVRPVRATATESRPDTSARRTASGSAAPGLRDTPYPATS